MEEITVRTRSTIGRHIQYLDHICLVLVLRTEYYNITLGLFFTPYLYANLDMHNTYHMHLIAYIYIYTHIVK